jgi:pimeloyl-ACP methyl ester carboxylesterase
LAAGIESAQYVELADASHAVTIQCAAEVNSALADHFARAEIRIGTVIGQLSQSTDR